MGEAWQHDCACIGRRTAGDYETRFGERVGHVLHKPRHSLACEAVGRFIESVEQNRALAGFKLVAEELFVEPPGVGLAQRTRVVGQLGRGLVAGRGGGLIVLPLEVLGQVGYADEDGEGPVPNGQPVLGSMRIGVQAGIA